MIMMLTTVLVVVMIMMLTTVLVVVMIMMLTTVLVVVMIMMLMTVLVVVKDRDADDDNNCDIDARSSLVTTGRC